VLSLPHWYDMGATEWVTSVPRLHRKVSLSGLIGSLDGSLHACIYQEDFNYAGFGVFDASTSTLYPAICGEKLPNADECSDLFDGILRKVKSSWLCTQVNLVRVVGAQSKTHFFLNGKHFGTSLYQLNAPIAVIGNSAKLIEHDVVASPSPKGKEPAREIQLCGGNQPIGRLRRVQIHASIPEMPERWSPDTVHPTPPILQRLNHCPVAYTGDTGQRRFFRISCKSSLQTSETGVEHMMVTSAAGVLLYSHELRFGHYCLDVKLMTPVTDCVIGILDERSSNAGPNSTVGGLNTGALWEAYTNIVADPTTDLASAHVRCYYSIDSKLDSSGTKVCCTIKYAVNGQLLETVVKKTVSLPECSRVAGCVPAVRFDSASVVLISSQDCVAKLTSSKTETDFTGLLSPNIFEMMYQESSTLRSLIAHQETLQYFSDRYTTDNDDPRRKANLKYLQDLAQKQGLVTYGGVLKNERSLSSNMSLFMMKMTKQMRKSFPHHPLHPDDIIIQSGLLTLSSHLLASHAASLKVVLDFTDVNNDAALLALQPNLALAPLYVLRVWLHSIIQSTGTNFDRPSFALDRLCTLRENKSDLFQDTLLSQFLEKFSLQSSKVLAMLHGDPDENDRPFEVKLIGEGASDYGGPMREVWTQLGMELSAHAGDLLIPCANGRMSVGENRGTLIPNPALCKSHELENYEKLGAMLGMGIRFSMPLGIPFPNYIWKLLCSVPVAEAEFGAYDTSFVSMLDRLRHPEKHNITQDTFEYAFDDVFFVITRSDGVEVPLKEDGDITRLTWHNRLEFAELALQARLSESQLQVDAIRSGLLLAIPPAVLRLFPSQFLQVLGTGLSHITADQLRRLCSPGSSLRATPLLTWFYEILDEMTEAELRLLCRFFGGADRITPNSRFSLQVDSSGTPEENDARLPTSATCSEQLTISKYSSKAILKEKLMFAIQFCSAIDTDYHV